MSKPVAKQIARPPVPKQRADASPVPNKDASPRRSRSTAPASSVPEAPAATPALELGTTGGFIWS